MGVASGAARDPSLSLGCVPNNTEMASYPQVEKPGIISPDGIRRSMSEQNEDNSQRKQDSFSGFIKGVFAGYPVRISLKASRFALIRDSRCMVTAVNKDLRHCSCSVLMANAVFDPGQGRR